MLLLRLFLSFAKIGFFSFGGLTMIPVINEEVLRFGWMTSREVLDIVAIAEMTPGSLGINAATFVGLRVGGVPGALLATIGTMTPSLTLCMAAAHFISKFRENKILNRILQGVRPVCFGMLIAVAITLGKTTFFYTGLVHWSYIAIAVIVGIALFKFKLSIPKAIMLAAVLGLVLN